jgi:hypothetical protein
MAETIFPFSAFCGGRKERTGWIWFFGLRGWDGIIIVSFLISKNDRVRRSAKPQAEIRPPLISLFGWQMKGGEYLELF